MSMAGIRDRALEIALTQIGVREEGGPNCGPQVERYLAAVGLPAGKQWCCAFVVWCYQEAARAHQLEVPLRRTGKVARLWQRARGVWRSEQPSVGAVMIHLADPHDADSTGHTGIVTGFNEQTVACVEGNTNAEGSRVGDRVRVNHRQRDYVLGYIDIGRVGDEEVA